MKRNKMALMLGLLLLAANVFAGTTPQSANVIAFGESKTLLVGDSKSGTIYAYTIAATENKAAQMGYNLSGIDYKVAAFLKTSVDKILARGFAINPVNKEAYISFDKISGSMYVPLIIIINQAGAMRLMDLAKTPHTEIKLKDPNTQDFKLWSDASLRSMTITAIKMYKNKVYVCGLSNAEFSSTLRVFDFPFNGKASSSSVEMYHTVHSQKETRAPMRNLDFVTVEGKDYLVGSYTCTPFVAVALEDLKDGAQVTAKTLAEMAVGNTPIDLFSYIAQDWSGNKSQVMLLTNKNHAAELIKVTDIIAAINKDGITTPMPTSGVDKEGMPSDNIPQLIGVVHTADQDDYHVATLRRNLETGTLDLLSFMKGAWIRMDEFESEFAFPTYRYTPDKKQIRDFQGMNLKDVGKPEIFIPKDK
jgi:hypothetical protein